MRNSTYIAVVGLLLSAGCTNTAYIASGQSEVSMQSAIEQAQQQVQAAEARGCSAKDISTGIGLSHGIGIGIGEGFTLSENCPECNDTLVKSSKSKQQNMKSQLFAVNVLMICPVEQ